MKQFVTLVKNHGSEDKLTLFGPDVPHSEQRAENRRIRGAGTHETFSWIGMFELVEVSKCRLGKPGSVPTPSSTPQPVVRPDAPQTPAEETPEPVSVAEQAPASADKPQPRNKRR